MAISYWKSPLKWAIFVISRGGTQDFLKKWLKNAFFDHFFRFLVWKMAILIDFDQKRLKMIIFRGFGGSPDPPFEGPLRPLSRPVLRVKKDVF